MAKNVSIVAFVVALSCFCSLAYATTKSNLFVEGRVYCDPCRVQFETRLSVPLEGAVVALECRGRENGTLAYTLQGKTDKNGIYSLPTDEDMEEQICEVRTVSSPRANCNEHFEFERARVLLTYNNGVKSMARYANPLGFMQKESVTECEQVLKELFPEETEEV
ncbi:hypothetical protein PRUPE_4G167200 [Prunus persica]|uniref:Olee1-like protein n=1 Tax=Prunus persica TaxID=3760 RepID=M5WZI3_PRUPE|nr:olee1-like protein [Prunus persica]ONI12473.1 hypothetical protein PRUPE_4G167200 [Prunus persica]